ncbi:patatin-like phospholipase family protein [Aeromonas salmonicida]|uniref:patatin-like phospholipase family protein n=1 Tax=Aeromonas salmonicida TaxID=645 RepID=UPI00073BDE51|nr:patatin-like phospholipase family protein [Aeromonas salmonicida]KTA79798.1 serine protease [Aeromonas salmonicida]MBS2781356.1 patatin-like phospholipase family protein [Aeromonas salmonicida]MCE9934744.1 patatin-like phospholipase family protein [Aeromonas salmonicida]MCE9969290.1 patatin-like phospholipase family protein [Aeromonas salmonicida]MDE7528904.1 patatin-like phospholipase family protein [Aeromonas salmonicida]
MRIFRRGWTHLFLILLAGLPLMAAAQSERPRIALVLSGGGAKGSAHIGILKVLEEKRIPVDIIVGTSMGSYVAGMYAMGLSAEEVERTTLAIDWNKGYQDKVGRDELSLRKKQQSEKYQLRTDIGVNGDAVQFPDGFFQGQSMASLLRHATSNLPAQKSFDDLPIPYRAVATDMETVTPFVLEGGSLAKAMQASMSIPGALKPVEWEGHILADGGTVNNMPVDVAKGMGADVVIAVDIGARLRTRESLKSGLAMIDQLTTYMTQVGTDKQRALLGPQDILLTPEFGNMGIADFSLMPEGIKQGEAVANRAATQLDALSLSPREYAVYRNQKLSRRAERSGQPAYYIDKVEILNKSRLSDETVRAMLKVKPDKIQTNESLEAGIRRLYALESFDRITYEVEERDGENVLVVDASEKNWGPGYLNFQFGFSDDFESSSNYNVGMSYTLTNLNEWGAEWLTEASLGTAKHLKTDFYSPLEPSQTFYGEASFAYDKTQRRIFLPEDTESTQGLSYVDSEYGFTSADLAVGWNRQPWSRISLGLEGKVGGIDVRNINDASVDASSWGPYVRFEHDTLDSRYFPYEGAYWDIKGGYSTVRLDNNEDIDDRYEGINYHLSMIKPWSWDRHSLNLLLEGGGSTSQEEYPLFVQDLGGLFRMSGFQRYQLSGRYSLFGGLRYIYRVVDNDFGALRAPLYLGGSLEQGGVWDKGEDISIESSFTGGSVYVGIESFLGPIFLGYGMAEGGNNMFYLQLGTTFE